MSDRIIHASIHEFQKQDDGFFRSSEKKMIAHIVMQQINPHILAIDLGGHNLRTALVNEQAQIIDPKRVRTHADRTPEAVIEQITAEVKNRR
ncbi:MAG: hypothetical protein R3A45_10915 [Bdellovibrionota bacterium]